MKKFFLMTMMAVVLAAGAVVAAGCGSDDSESPSGPNGADRAFATEMAEHHRMAIAMAEMALEQAEESEIRQLAGEIISTQNAEIADLERIDADLAQQGIEVGELSHSMDPMSEADMQALEQADPFDQEFITMMTAHHEDAIMMAEAELEEGGDTRLHDIANAIIEAQQREIDQMADWSMEWYGEAPESSMEETGSDGMEGMDH